MAFGYKKRESARAKHTAGVSYKETGKKPKLGSGKRFSALKETLAKKKGIKTPGALAAFIGRKRYGSDRFQKIASAARRRLS